MSTHPWPDPDFGGVNGHARYCSLQAGSVRECHVCRGDVERYDLERALALANADVARVYRALVEREKENSQ